jgi:putative peptidoglycan lipid II flippase
MGNEGEKTLSAQGWASASAILLGVTGASKGLGLFRELLLASYLGASGQVDAYAVAYAVPLFLGGGVGYAFSTALIPGYHHKVVECGREAGIRFLSTMCLSSQMWSLVLLIPVWVMPEILVRFAAPSLPEATMGLTVDLMGWLALYVFIQNGVYVLSAVFHTFNHFRLPAAIDLIFNVTVIGVLVALANKWEIRALLIGNLTGIAACFLLLTIVLLRGRWKSRLLAIQPKELVRPLVICLPVMAYYFASQSPAILANYFASGLGEGSIAAFGYAKTLLTAVVTLLTLSIARGAFPTFAVLSAGGRTEEFRQLVTGLAKLILFMFLPLSTLAWVYREPVLRLLYQHGVFDDAALVLTATAFGFLALGLTFAAWEPVGTRALYAAGDARGPLLATIGSLCSVLPLLIVLTPALGLGGVALSLSLALAVDSGLQMFSLGLRLESPMLRNLAVFSAKCAACALLAGSPFLVAPVNDVWAVVTGGVCYVGLYSLFVQSLVQPIPMIVSVART